jgi:hypothetical protein
MGDDRRDFLRRSGNRVLSAICRGTYNVDAITALDLIAEQRFSITHQRRGDQSDFANGGADCRCDQMAEIV